jgi:hypothetical protein
MTFTFKTSFYSHLVAYNFFFPLKFSTKFFFYFDLFVNFIHKYQIITVILKHLKKPKIIFKPKKVIKNISKKCQNKNLADDGRFMFKFLCRAGEFRRTLETGRTTSHGATAQTLKNLTITV